MTSASQESQRALFKRMVKDPFAWICTGLGTGFSPVAPGTAGSLLAVVIWYVWLADLHAMYQLMVLFVVFAVGWVAISNYCVRYAVADDPKITIDEVLGQLLALFALPKNIGIAFCAFVLFRLFDVLKPGFIRRIDQKVPGAAGILLDDLLAGFIPCVWLQLMLLGFPEMAHWLQ